MTHVPADKKHHTSKQRRRSLGTSKFWGLWWLISHLMVGSEAYNGTQWEMDYGEIPHHSYKHVEVAAQDWQLQMESHQLDQGGDGQWDMDLVSIHSDVEVVEEPYGEVVALQSMAGTRQALILRANPFNMNRPMHFRLNLLQHRTEVQQMQAITQTWPDLPGTDWRIITVNAHVQESQNVHETCVLLWAALDLMHPNDGRITVNEDRVWHLRTGSMMHRLQAFSGWRSYATSLQFFIHVDRQDECDMTPCIVTTNGVQNHWRGTVAFRDGDFITVEACEEEAQLRTVIADPTVSRWAMNDEMPASYQQQVARQAHMQPDKVWSLVRQYQACLTEMARSIYHLTGMQKLQGRRVAIHRATVEEVRQFTFWHEVTKDPFGLVYDLKEQELVAHDDLWNLIPIHNSVMDPTIPDEAQWVALLHGGDRPGMMVTTVVRKVFHQNKQMGGRTFTTYLAKFLEVIWNMEDFYQNMEIHRVCQIHRCKLQINGADPTGANLEDGDFIDVNIYQSEPEERARQEQDTQIIAHKDSDSTQEEPDSKRRRTRSEGTTDPIPPPGGAITVCWTIAVTMKMLPPMRSRVQKRQGARGKAGWNLRQKFFLVMIAWSVTTVSSLQTRSLTPHRFGEALHPGPLWIGSTNPSGLKNKEWIYGELPPGIWGCSETQLAKEAIPKVNKTLARVHSSRHLTLCHGAPAPVRARSTEAGAWTGTGFVSDLHPRPVQLQWKYQEYQAGRVQVAQFWWGPQRILATSLYLWPRGPTWPKATEASNLLLEQVTKEVVLSRTGFRAIVGDFNHDETQLQSIAVWKQQGWFEIQQCAEERWNREITMTCKGRTVRDFVWLSPEFKPFVQEARVWELFADHAAVAAKIDIPIKEVIQKVWPMAAYIPWHKVDKAQWEQSTILLDKEACEGSVHDHYEEIWRAYEESFKNHIDAPNNELPPNCRGRGTKGGPKEREAQCTMVRPSRQGEVQMKDEGLGRTVQKWFLQLRRLQSLRHALRADKQTINAELYRIGLWRSIRRGKGFEEGFTEWWKGRPHKLQGSPKEIPERLPKLEMVDLIYDDYHWNYRRFEAWHAARRQESLEATYEGNHYKIFAEVKPEPKGYLHQLEETTEANIIGVSEDQEWVQLDRPLPQADQATYKIDDFPAEVQLQDADESACLYKVDSDGLIWEGQMVTQTRHYTTPQAIQQQLEEFWKARWWTHQRPSESDWARILAFGKQFLPRGQLKVKNLTLEQWSENIKRYGAKSARGPDSVDRLDLQYMPDTLRREMVRLLQRCEYEREWPDQASSGFVHPLAKKDGAICTSDFRPVIIYSITYRTWSSIRAKQILQRMSTCASTRQFGFLPHKEATQVWAVTQAAIEMTIATGGQLNGFITDIQKAFENIPRQPVRELSLHLGINEEVVDTWFRFLEKMERYFMVLGEVGGGVQSNRGFPEGCALSCTAMAIVNLTFHAYLERYNSRCREISYVDNLAMLSQQEGLLYEGILCIETWADMWKLDLDRKKSYVWSTDKATRQAMQTSGC